MDKGLSPKDVKPEHLTGIYKELYAALSAELPEDQAICATVTIAGLYGGESPYFPKIGSITNELRDAQIRKEFDGTNYRELSKKYDLTIAYVRELLKRKPK